MLDVINKMKKDLDLKGYSPKTKKMYIRYVERFAEYYGKPFEQLGTTEIRNYLYLFVNKYSQSYVNNNYSALKFLYQTTLNKEWNAKKIPRTKKRKKLPIILSQAEVKSIFSVTNNLKHKAMLMTTYSAGLRVSETAQLKLKDIDSKNMQIRVNQGKGKKDRYTLLSKANLNMLREYWKLFKPNFWLFPGMLSKKPITTRTIQKVFKKAAKNAGIKKKVSIHTLRHCFATHLLEAGIDIYHIQILMGHTSPKTTSVYIHLTRKDILTVKSPLDIMMDDDQND